MSNCPNCGHELAGHLNFCTQCGHRLREPVDQLPETQAPLRSRSSLEKYLTRDYLVPVFGLAGIILILVAIFNLVDPDIVDTDFTIILTILGGTGIFLWLAGGMMLLLGKLNSLSRVLLYGTGEAMVFAVLYLNDLLFRSSLNRHLLLIWVIQIVITGLVFPEALELDFAGNILQISSTYVGFVMITVLSSSDYFDDWVFTGALLIVVLLTHFVVIRSESAYLLFWAIPLEFITLLQSSVINSTIIFPTSLLIIISIPVLLFLYRDRSYQLILFEQFSSLELMLVLPQAALAFVISNGGLNSPFSEILLGLFIVSWLIYIFLVQQFSRSDSISNSKREISGTALFSVQTILSLALLGFSLSDRFLTSMILIVVIFILPFLYLDSDLIQLAMLIVFGVTLSGYAILVVLHDHNDILLYTTILGVTLLQYGVFQFLSTDILTEKEMAIYSVWIGVFTVLQSIVQVEFLAFLVVNVVFQLVFHQLSKGKSNIQSILTALMISLPSVLVINLPSNDLLIWIVLGIQLVSIVIVMISGSYQDKLIVISVLALPLIFLLSLEVDNFYLNLVVGTITIIGLYFLISGSKIMDNQLLGAGFLLSSIVLRAVIPTESGLFAGYPVDLITISLVLFAFTLGLILLYLTGFENQKNLISLAIWTAGVIFALDVFLDAGQTLLMQLTYFGAASLFIILYFVKLISSSDGRQIDRLIILVFYLIFTYFGSHISTYYIPWIIFSGLLLLNNFQFQEADTRFVGIIYVLSLVLNFAAIGGIDTYYLMTSLVILSAIVVIPGRFRFTLEALMEERFYLGLVILETSILFAVIGIFVELEYLVFMQSLISFGSLCLLLVYLVFEKKYDGFGVISSMTIGLATIYLQQLNEVSWIMFVVSLFSIMIILTQEKILLRKLDLKGEIVIDHIVLSFIMIYLIVLVQLGTVVIDSGLIGFEEYNQVLVGLGIISVILGAVLMRVFAPSYLSYGLIYSGGAIFVITNFVGFYEVIISNVLYASVALITAGIGLYTRNQSIFYMGLALSSLSVVRAILGWFLLEDPERSISVLIVGIQIVIYVMVFSNVGDKYFTGSNEEIEPKSTNNDLSPKELKSKEN